MKVAELSTQTRKRIREMRYDRIINKHEGPFDWARKFQIGSPKFMQINGFDVLLPLDKEERPNVTILRCIVGDGGQSLTIFLKDTTYIDDPSCEFFQAGFVAVCDKMPGEDFVVAILYHEWFIVDNTIPVRRKRRPPSEK